MDIKFLTLKKILLLLIGTFVISIQTFSQNDNDGLPKSDSCFLALKADTKSRSVPLAKTFCVGDKIKVKLGDKKTIQGEINRLSRNSIVTANGYEIDVSKIKWIKKSKLTASRAIAGGLLTTAGVALFIPVAEGNVDFDQVALQGGLGIALVTTGIAVFTSRTKFNLEKGDKLIFKE